MAVDGTSAIGDEFDFDTAFAEAETHAALVDAGALYVDEDADPATLASDLDAAATYHAEATPTRRRAQRLMQRQARPVSSARRRRLQSGVRTVRRRVVGRLPAAQMQAAREGRARVRVRMQVRVRVRVRVRAPGAAVVSARRRARL